MKDKLASKVFSSTLTDSMIAQFEDNLYGGILEKRVFDIFHSETLMLDELKS